MADVDVCWGEGDEDEAGGSDTERTKPLGASSAPPATTQFVYVANPLHNVAAADYVKNVVTPKAVRRVVAAGGWPRAVAAAESMMLLLYLMRVASAFPACCMLHAAAPTSAVASALRCRRYCRCCCCRRPTCMHAGVMDAAAQPAVSRSEQQ